LQSINEIEDLLVEQSISCHKNVPQHLFNCAKLYKTVDLIYRLAIQICLMIFEVSFFQRI